MNKKSRVLTFGTFDLVHPGHVFYLQEAKKHGDELVVIIARDTSVFKFKHHLPYKNEQERKKDIKKLNIANKIELGHLTKYFDCLHKYAPSIVCLGYDQFSVTQKLKEYIHTHNLPIQILRIGSYFPEKYKSSLLKKK